MLQTLQLSQGEYPTPAHDDPSPAPEPEEVLVPACAFACGTSAAPWAYDNERPEHTVELPAFAIERYPVTNARYVEFVEDGGYRDPRHWSAEGWAWRGDESAEAPLSWERSRQRVAPPALRPARAPAACRAGAARLVLRGRGDRRVGGQAASDRSGVGEGRAGRLARRPGTANLGREAFGPLPVAPRATSDVGCECMLGDVWEWTSTPFAGYPGFSAFPYAEYSEVFFGDEYRVLRGGSWATDPLVARITFRNWDYPQRRQIFSGVRLARDA